MRILPLMLILFSGCATAQKTTVPANAPGYIVHYDVYNNDQKVSRQPMPVLTQNNVVYLGRENDKIQTYVDFGRRELVTITSLDDQRFKSIESFDSLPQPRMENEMDTVLGYPLKKMVFSSFSNTIEAWYTNSLPFAISPNASYVAPGNGAILKLRINGNRVWQASKIEALTAAQSRPYEYASAKTLTAPEMEEMKIRGRYEVVKVFENEQINFEEIQSPKDLAQMETGKTYRFSSGTIIVKKIDISKWKGKNVSVFARMTTSSQGDAYDRTGSIFMIPAQTTGKTLMNGLVGGAESMPSFTGNDSVVYYGMRSQPGFEPAIEWMRFFTPFGVGHFNTRRVINNYPWANEAYYKQDVSALFPQDQDAIWVGAYIGNYDKGGHRLSLELDIYPEGSRDSATKYMYPVFNAVNLMEMSGQRYARFFRGDTLSVEFNIPAGLKDAYLLYTTTGHGGWGNGDEFVPKTNQLLVDGKPFYTMVPWRTDCATYRLLNPASGNFGSGLSSSDLSRSNWCPGTITPPVYIPLSGLPAGNHRLQVVIDQGADEGSSFSFWNVSGMLIGNLAK